METYKDLELHWGGRFVWKPQIQYVGGKIFTIEGLSMDITLNTLTGIYYAMEPEFSSAEFYFRPPGESLDEGLRHMRCDKDVQVWLSLYKGEDKIELYGVGVGEMLQSVSPDGEIMDKKVTSDGPPCLDWHPNCSDGGQLSNVDGSVIHEDHLNNEQPNTAEKGRKKLTPRKPNRKLFNEEQHVEQPSQHKQDAPDQAQPDQPTISQEQRADNNQPDCEGEGVADGHGQVEGEYVGIEQNDEDDDLDNLVRKQATPRSGSPEVRSRTTSVPPPTRNSSQQSPRHRSSPPQAEASRRRRNPRPMAPSRRSDRVRRGRSPAPRWRLDLSRMPYSLPTKRKEESRRRPRAPTPPHDPHVPPPVKAKMRVYFLQKRYRAKVLEVNPPEEGYYRLRVHYEDFGDRWDEWISMVRTRDHTVVDTADYTGVVPPLRGWVAYEPRVAQPDRLTEISDIFEDVLKVECPFSIRRRMIEDEELSLHIGRIIRIPIDVNSNRRASQILSRYTEFRANHAGPVTQRFIEILYNRLPQALERLYHQTEVDAYRPVVAAHGAAHGGPVNIFGAEMLLRMIVRFPAIFLKEGGNEIDDDIREELKQFLSYLANHESECFAPPI